MKKLLLATVILLVSLNHVAASNLPTSQGTRVNFMEGVHGKDHPSSIPLIQMDMDGNFIAESAVDASRFLGGGLSRVARVCRGERRQTGGFK